ncbi:MAG: alpha-L-fucosidase, partial [Bacteroidales bacterium]|nr:alpha-L-fucosidase [Bacteroidales bacterium]
KSWVKGDTLPVQVKKQIHKLAMIAARGGNFLLNIGPRSDGTVVPYEEAVLNEMGSWVRKNEEAIFGTETTPFMKSPWGECTRKPGKLFIHVANWPEDGHLEIPGLVSRVKKAYPLAHPEHTIEVMDLKNGKSLKLSEHWKDPYLTILVLEYDGDLNISDPVLKANDSGEVIIGNNDWIKHGKYGKVSYRSILKDSYRTVNIEIPRAGRYNVRAMYRMAYPQKRFILSAGDQVLSFELYNDRSGYHEKGEELFDGIESSKHKEGKAANGAISCLLGTMEFVEAGSYELMFDQGEVFEFKPTLEEFNRQDRKYMSMNIVLELLKFEPLD